MKTNQCNRREFLKGAGLAAGAAFAARRGAAAQSDRKRPPNILFCIADDWSWPHASGVDDKVVRTPTFDRIVREGILFPNAFVTAPSCTPSRGSIVTGQWHWRLEEGGNLWSTLPAKFAVYPDLLGKAGDPAGGGAPYDPKRTYGDIDDSPTKTYMIQHRDDPGVRRLFDLAVAKRPAEELYDLRQDPDQFKNVADDPAYAKAKEDLAGRLTAELKASGDPRVIGNGDVFDNYPYYGGQAAGGQKAQGKKQKKPK